MATDLEAAATSYFERYGQEVCDIGQVRSLYKGYASEKQQALQNLLDAATSALTLNTFLGVDQVDLSRITPQMEQAYELAFSRQAVTMTLVERLEELSGASEESASGFLNTLKGKLFEVIVRDKLNAGEQVGELHLWAGQVATLALNPTQPGYDLIIKNSDGTVDELLQLKATDSVVYIRDALETNPQFRVLATDEGADEYFNSSFLQPESVLRSGVSDIRLEEDVAAPVEDLLDSPIENLVETTLPGLPFLLITLTEGRKVLVGKQTFQDAVDRGLGRGAATATAMGVAYLASLAGAGVVTLPATFLTRAGISRFTTYRGLARRIDEHKAKIGDIATARAEATAQPEL